MTITNSNPEDKAREAYGKSSSRFEGLLEIPFPQAAREFAEKTIDQTRDAYGRSNRTLEAAVQTLEKSFDAAGQSAVELRRNIIDIAYRNLNLGFDLAKNLANASNLSELVELQAAYWRKQFDAFTTQADEAHNRLMRLYAPEPKTTESPTAFIRNETAKKAPFRAQEAPARDPAEGQRRDPQKLGAPPVAGSTVRPLDESQSGARKKGAPGDERAQSLLAEIKFGMLDGNAVRFTSLEAWWLVDGAWRPISPDEVLLNAAVMREARFNQLFAKVPRLPSNAFKSDNLQD
jgi:phasin